MPVIDVDGDGDADIISSSAHHYGLWWYEQTPHGWMPRDRLAFPSFMPCTWPT